MLKDQYDNALTTSSQSACQNYIEGIDRILAGSPDMTSPFEAAIAADDNFALAYVGLARAQQLSGDSPSSRATIADAEAHSGGITTRESAHLHAMNLLLTGRVPEGYKAVRAHVADHPRDALVAQTATSVFGLIGFSGMPGREAELLAYTSELMPHYGEDWWCLGQHAFSLCETGQLDRASDMIDLSLSLNPKASHSAHVRSHIYYEVGETDRGVSYLKDWLSDYDRSGIMHGHLSWHVALWALEMGDVSQMWEHIDASVKPGVSQGLPINIMTDTASILYRAEIAGVAVPKERWQEISDYATQFFPKTSLGFVDIHAALAHAMAGNNEELSRIIDNPRGPCADLVREVAEAYRAVVSKNWGEATSIFLKALTDHARLGGSRAQRDLLDFSLLNVLLKQGKDEEASHLLQLRRPALIGSSSIHGLNVH